MGDQNLPLERSWYIGNTIFAILYGIELCMFFMSTCLFISSSRAARSKYFYVGFSGTLLLITIAMSCNLLFGQMMWIEHRDIPGGPWPIFPPTSLRGTTPLAPRPILLPILSEMDSWHASPPIRATITHHHLPVMGIIFAVQSGLPDGNFFRGRAVHFGTPWLVLTITFNVVATALIILRLKCVIRGMRDVLARSRAEVYLNVISILIQSALPFTLLGIGYVITRLPETRHSDTSYKSDTSQKKTSYGASDTPDSQQTRHAVPHWGRIQDYFGYY
ncbi:hypothetical protein C8R45DRAFT_1069620 [Mycena sanguinolenta]|nr:hypothetical protein C8R45DRAFT_1069620 [Mycena sanguinolenta]